MLRVKSIRNLLLLMQGQFVTNLGSLIYDVAMLLWIKELTGSAAIMGLAMLLSGLPEALLAPFGGRIADRYGRLRVIILSDFVSALTVGFVLIAILSGIGPLAAITALCIGNALLGLSSACFGPAVASLIPSLVAEENLEKGNAALQFSRIGGQALGQGLGGLLFALLGVSGTFLVNALSYFGSAFSEIWIRVPKKTKNQAVEHPRKSLLKETLSMVVQVWREPETRALLLLIAAFHLCLSCLPILLPYYAEHILLIADAWFGVFMAIYTIGIMFGFVVAGVQKPPRDRFRRIGIAAGTVGLLFVLLASTSSIVAAVIALLGIGVGIGVVIVNLMTELQLVSPEAERGGIMGTAQAIGGSSFPIGMAMTGLLLDGLVQQGVSQSSALRAVIALAAAVAITAAVAGLAKRSEIR
ncbi:MAG: MFS transporter [Hyphomicrobiales bacterium]|nr:MFS transporter [Hyphomicrobiales bacterium]